MKTIRLKWDRDPAVSRLRIEGTTSLMTSAIAEASGRWTVYASGEDTPLIAGVAMVLARGYSVDASQEGAIADASNEVVRRLRGEGIDASIYRRQS